MPEPVSPPKRVVLRYLTGRFAGLDRIIGLDDSGATLPPVLENVVLLDLGYPAGLTKVTPRYVFYQEIAEPIPHALPATFHPEQR